MTDEHKKNILLVEDEAIIGIAQKKQLENKSYNINLVSSGEKAVQIIVENTFPVDLILMDIDLGSGIDGTQAAEQILKHKDIPVVFLSSHTEPAVVEKTEKITSYGYVVKNSGIVILDTSIKMALKLFNEKTERKRAEHAVILSEENYRFQFMNMNSYNSLYEVLRDKDGRPYDFRFIMVNYAYEEYVGKKSSELIGRTLLEVYPGTEQYWIDKMIETVETGKPVHFQNYSREMNTNTEINLYIPREGQLAMTTGNFNERKKAEEELRRSELKFRTLHQSMMDAFVSVDMDGSIIDCNESYLKLLGYDREEISRLTYQDITPEKWHDFETGIVENQVMPKGYSEIYEKEYRRKDGTVFPVELRTILMRDTDGSPVSMWAIVRDITGRKLAEEILLQKNDDLNTANEELQAAIEELETTNEELADSLGKLEITGIKLSESEERFRILFEHAPVGVVQILTESGVFVSINQKYADIVGYTIEEMKSLNFQKITHPDDLQNDLDNMHRLKTGEIREFSMEKRYYHKNGSTVWVNLAVSPMWKTGEKPTYHIAVVEDITRRKLAEEALRMSVYELKKSQEVARVGSWVWHISDNKVEWSDEMYRIFNIQKDGFTGDLTNIIIDRIHPEDREKVISSNESVVKSKAPIPVEYRVLWPDGNFRVVWAEAGELVSDGSGRPILLRGIVLDITERKLAEEALRERNKELYCLKVLSDIIEKTESLDIILSEFVNEMPKAWYYPEIACARIICEGNHYTTENFLETGWRQSSDIRAFEKVIGRVDLCYLEKRQIRDEGPFLKEERNLINMICERLQHVIERIKTKKALQESEARLRAIGDNMPAGQIYQLRTEKDGTSRFTYVSAGVEKLHECTAEEALNDISLLFNRVIPDDIPAWMAATEKSIREMSIFDHELRIRRKSGEIRWHRMISRPRLAEDGTVLFDGIDMDVTDYKLAENEIKKQLTEKETLLREVHHRIKNNMANIENLLILQIDSSSDPEIKSALQVAISRVQSMRVLYDKLLLKKDFQKVSIKNYIEDLINSILDVFADRNNIIIEKYISEFDIPSRQATTVGIIINELLTNVYKYAFINRDNGRVSISIDKNDHMATLIIHDNGSGFDERIAANKSSGLGLTIVKILVEQLNGTYSITNENGTKSVIQFSL